MRWDEWCRGVNWPSLAAEADAEYDDDDKQNEDDDERREEPDVHSVHLNNRTTKKVPVMSSQTPRLKLINVIVSMSVAVRVRAAYKPPSTPPKAYVINDTSIHSYLATWLVL